MKPTVKLTFVTAILSASLLLLALFPARLAASSLTLAWNPSKEDDLAGYKVYYGTQSRDYDYFIDVGDVTEYTITGLAYATRYYFTLTAYDIWWNESDFSAEVSAITTSEPSPSSVLIGSEGGGGGCFIAAAAYSTYLNPHVKILREFRDEFLISNSLGRKFVYVYYQYGPRLANRIGEYGSLRFVTRQALLPLIGMSSLALKTTASQKLLLLLFLCPVLIFAPTLRSYRHQIL